MRTSAIIILILLVATVLVLIPPRAIAPAAHELTMATWGMPFEDLLFRDRYARGFEQENPGWKVHYQRHAQLIEKYNAWHVQNRGADVMRMGIDYYHSFVAKGMLTPLTQYLHDPEVGLTEEEIRDYFPAIWETLWIEGEIYALPSDNAQYGLYYNKTIFDEYNAAHPEDPIPYPSAAWSWDDLAGAAQRLTVREVREDGSNGPMKQYGILFDLWAWPFLTFLKQAGGEMWDADQTTTLINSDAGVEALTFLVSLVPPDAPIRSAELAASAASPAELYKTGTLAMLLEGSWRATNIELDSPHLDFAIAPLPRGIRPGVVSGSVLWAVSSHCANPREAWRMIKWMTNRENSIAYWNSLRVAPPSLLSVVQSPEFRSTTGIVQDDRELVPPMRESMYEDRAAWLEYAVTPDPVTGLTPGFVPAAPYQFDLQDQIATALRQATRGERTPKQALDEAAARTHEIIDRDRASRGLPAVDRSR